MLNAKNISHKDPTKCWVSPKKILCSTHLLYILAIFFLPPLLTAAVAADLGPSKKNLFDDEIPVGQSILCSETDATGFNWGKNRWVQVNFKKHKYIIILVT